MFEAVIALCATMGTPCRDHLLPGYEAASLAACVEALADMPPALPDLGLVSSGAARCAPRGETLSVEEAAPGVFVHLGAVAEPGPSNRGDVANLGFVIGDRSVAVIDTGSARWIGEALWRAIRAETALPVSHVVLTHMHPDHVLGTGPFAEAGAEVVGHARLGRALADRADTYLERFETLIGAEAFLGSRMVAVTEAGPEIDLGGRVLTLEAWPAAHTGNDLTVFDRETGIFFAGDLVFQRHTPTLDGSLRGWRAVLEPLMGRTLTGLVPGHGGPLLDWPRGGEDTARYLEVLERDTRAALEAGLRLGEAVEEIAESEAGAWALFDAYNARNATVAFTELEWE